MHKASWFTVAAMIVITACGGGGGKDPGVVTGPGPTPGPTGGCPANTQCFGSSTFDPTSLTVAVGTTVAFINDSGIGHTVNFDGTRPPGVDDIPLHTSGEHDRKFTQAGTFNFHCTQHAGMTGKIIVQ